MSSRTRLRHVARRAAAVAALCGSVVLAGASSGRSTLPVPAHETGFVVIVHAGNATAGIERDDLSKMFLKRLVKWPDGQQTEPVDLAPRQLARRAFSSRVHKKTTAAVLAYWQQQIFSGREVPPAEKATEKDVIAFVKAHPGGIGYVSAGSVYLTGVKVLPVRGTAP